VKDFLATASPEVRNLAMRLRELLLDLAPDAEEELVTWSKMICYGYGPKYDDKICGIAVYKNYVSLNINRGTELPDPAGLMEGAGKVHRHIKVPSPELIGSRPLRTLLKSAVAATRLRRGESQPGSRQKRKTQAKE